MGSWLRNEFETQHRALREVLHYCEQVPCVDVCALVVMGVALLIVTSAFRVNEERKMTHTTAEPRLKYITVQAVLAVRLCPTQQPGKFRKSLTRPT